MGKWHLLDFIGHLAQCNIGGTIQQYLYDRRRTIQHSQGIYMYNQLKTNQKKNLYY